MGMHGERYPRFDTGTGDDFSNARGCHGAFPLVGEHIGRLPRFPLKAAECPKFRATQRMAGGVAVLHPFYMQQPLAEIHLFPTQAAKL